MPLSTVVQTSRVMDRHRWVIFLVAFAGLAGGLLAASEIPNLDSAWLFIATGRFIDGAVIGGDLFEMNPPLIYWLMAPAVWVSRHVASDYYLTYCLWVGLLGSVSSLLTSNLLMQQGISIPRASWAALAELVLFVFVSGSDYGQRDPIAYQLTSPFLWAEALRAKGHRMSAHLIIPSAVLAATGLLIKPYMAFVPAALFGWRIIRERSLLAIVSADAIVMLLIAATYVGYVAIYTPGYLRLAQLVMLAYSAYNSTELKLMISFVPVILAAGVLWLTLVRTSSQANAAAVQIFLIATLAFACGAITQMKGWYYHLVPCYLGLSSACIVYLTLQTSETAAKSVTRWIALSLPAVFVVIGVARASYFQRGTVAGWALSKVIRSSGEGSFLAITSSMAEVFPAVTEMGVEWASRAEAQWMVPAAIELSRGTPQQRVDAERLRVEATHLIMADLEKWQPLTVVTKIVRDQALSSPIDWIGFFSRDPGFARLWADYCTAGRTGEWQVYHRCGSDSAPRSSAVHRELPPTRIEAGQEGPNQIGALP
jgi:hypothetical protein